MSETLAEKLILAKDAIAFTMRWENEGGKQAVKEISSEQIAGLLTLLEVCGDSEALDEDTYDQFFEDDYPCDLAIDAATILAEFQVTESIAAMAAYVTRESDNELGGLYDHEMYLDLLAKFSPESGSEFVRVANDPTTGDVGKNLMWDAALRLADQHQELIDQFKPSLHEFLKHAENHSHFANGNAIGVAEHWQLTEASNEIERAFSNDLVDCGVCGDWETVQRLLGIEGEGLPMPKNPFNSLDEIMRDAGVGCFSKRPLYADGELQESAANAYYRLASQKFSESDEGKSLPADSPVWTVTTFLELGINYLGVTVDTMSLGDVQEILYELYPGKVSMPSEECPEVHRCLAAFWYFVAREYRVGNSAAIAVEMESSRDKFVDAMTNPSNFGMAKGMLAAGTEAGFDMSTEDGLNQFAMAYNASLGLQNSEPMEAFENGVPPLLNRPDAPIERVPSLVDGKTRKQRKKLLASKKKKAKKR